MRRPAWLIRPGSVPADQIPYWDERIVRGLSVVDLMSQLQGFDPNSLPHRLCAAELRRRENWTARAALVVSIVALVVSIFAVALKSD